MYNIQYSIDGAYFKQKRRIHVITRARIEIERPIFVAIIKGCEIDCEKTNKHIMQSTT